MLEAYGVTEENWRGTTKRFSHVCRSKHACSVNAQLRNLGESNVGNAMDVRAAEDVEIDFLTNLWHDGWHEAHAPIVPAELTRLRTLESFRERLQAGFPNVGVVGPRGEPVGFYMVKGNELYQLFVSPQFRGSGVAAALIADAEARLSRNGFDTAWLSCAIGNKRAARFYEKCGWHLVGTMINPLETSQGTFLLEVWRYEKSLTRPI